jgi:O-antigen ligase
MRMSNSFLHLPNIPWVHLILAVGTCSTLVAWGGYTIWPLALSLIGLSTWFRDRSSRGKWFEEPRVRTARRLIFSAFFCFIVFSVTLGIYHRNPVGGYQAVLPFIVHPLLASVIVRHQVTPLWFWIGTSAGAVVAALFAGFQIFVMGLSRAHGLINPITFGDTAVVLCAASLIGLSHLDFSQNENKKLRIWLVAGSIGGMIASLLSGSKGGWLSLCTVFVFAIIKIIRPINLAKKISTLLFIILLLITTFTVIPKETVQGRLESGWHGLSTWLKTGEVTEMSVSIRLELWTVGIQIFKENPWLGAGHEVTQQRRLDLAASGQFSPRVAEIKTFDNEYINRLANGGILGILPSILLFVLPFCAFYQFRNHANSSVKALAFLGMILPVLYMEFGLSVAIFGTNIFRQVYSSWLVTILAMIAVLLQNDAKKSLTNKSSPEALSIQHPP